MKQEQLHRAVSEENVNKNVNWLNGPGIWTWYLGLIAVAWLVATALTDDAGLAWTYVHIVHGVVTYYLLHWTKGSPCQEDQGKYDGLTFWEQIDNGTYGTKNRKLLTAVPLVLFCLATHGTDFRRQPLGVNLVIVLVLIIAKLPSMYRVRIFGINKY